MERLIQFKNIRIGFFIAMILILNPIVALTQLKADFSANRISGCTPLTVTFQDKSSGNPTSWRWDLGNGSLSNNQNPSASYFNAGTYTVSLKISNGAGQDSVTKTAFITVFENPVADFTVSNTSGCFPLNVTFQDLSKSGSGKVSKWSWDLGDGDTSLLQNPFHSYTVTGNYSVTLKVSNSNGCSNVVSKSHFVNVTSGVVDSFTNSPATYCKPPETINFSNMTTGPASLSYQWDFGDGGTSSSQNPLHTYMKPGTYSVQLITKSSAGCSDTLLKQAIITIRNYQTVISGPDTVCVSLDAAYNNNSSPAPLNSTWVFGDGTSSSLTTVTKSWITPGTYRMKLINDFGVCMDSVIKPISIVSPPAPNFTSSDSFNCKVPFTTQFTDLTGGGHAWLWNFGDGSTSTEQNPTHTYNKTGQFDVTLTLSNATGCTNTITKSRYINISKPVGKFSTLPGGGCVPFTYTGSAVITDPKGIASYSWDFGDGSTSDLKNPQHTYSSFGTYFVKLYYTTNDGCSDSIATNNKLQAGTPATVDFTAAPLTSCADQNIQFTNLSPSTDSWAWDFGDGQTSSDQNPQHKYSDSGPFSVQLTVTNSGCETKIKKTDFITILPPAAKFTPVVDCSNKTHVSFLDNSTLPQTWAWDFGDGSTSTAPNPDHTYAALGTYDVTITVTNGSCTTTKTTTLKLVDEHADFTASDDTVCNNAPVTFNVINSDPANIAKYTFDFGDGIITNSTTNKILHAFAAPGIYTVKLTITDINGCTSSLTRSKYITVIGPVAAFSVSPTTGCRGLDVTFTDHSITDGIHVIKSWEWNYGDGSTDNLSSPPFAHIFNAAGSYRVILKITDTNGCFDSSILTNPIQIIAPSADFSSEDTLACIESNVAFKNLSTENNSSDNLTYIWTLGNGSISTLDSVNTKYDSLGLYSVKLVAIDANGCKDSVQKNKYIRISIPKAGFTINDSVASCTPFEVNFTNTSVNNRGQLWDFGDGSSSNLKNPVHYYSKPGTYIATLYATLPGGCVDSFKRKIILHPSAATFKYKPLSGCSSVNAAFHVSTESLVDYFWDFGDGNTLLTNDSNTVHIYQGPGNFVPKVILTNSAGCQVVLTGKDTIHVTKSLVNFGIKNRDTVSCLGTTLSFIDSTKNNVPIKMYAWNFGDGTTSSLKDPAHLYAKTGAYTVSLITRTINGCNDTLIKNNYINVFGAVADFNISSAKGCANSSDIIFTDNSTTDGLHPISSWQWNYGDGIIENKSTAPFDHIYKTTGLFTPKLKITDSYGCVDTFTLRTSVSITDPKAAFTTSASAVCLGTAVNFNNASSGDHLTYSWGFGNELGSTQAMPSIIYPATGNYTVNLTVTDINGCRDTATKNITVNTQPKVSLNGNTASCINDSLRFSGIWANIDTSTVSWKWNFGNGQTSALQDPPIQFYPAAGSYPLQLILSTAAGCADTISTSITIHPLPQTNAGDDQNVCLNNTAQLNGVGADTYAWYPSDHLSCTSCANPVASPVDNIVYYVKGTNTFGCIRTDSIRLTVKKPFKVTVTPTSDSLCLGQSAKLTANGAELYHWSPANGLDNTLINTPVASPVSNTVYKVVGTDVANCFTDSAAVTINVFPYPTVNAGAGKNILFGENAPLSPVYSNDIVKYTWTPAAGLNCADCSAPVASPQISTVYTITVVNNGGCTSSDKINVFFPCQVSVFIPNTFSPNNDGMNDHFYPRGKDIYRIKSFRIFDRWGELVFQRTDFSANDEMSGWDGTFKGHPASSDVYTYVIEVLCNNNNISTFQGDVALIR